MVDRLQGVSVPKADGLISCPTTTRKETMLVRRPRYRLHRSYMARELGLGCLAVVHAPEEELVVVAPRGKLLLVEAPLQPAYLLFMSEQLSLKIVLSPQISVKNALVSTSRAQKATVPSNAPDALLMS